MLSLFKNHNMMMPVDFGDNPYTIKAEELSPKPALEASPSKWDWNKLFVPMQEAMKPKTSEAERADKVSLMLDDDFKYASPFASKSSFCCSDDISKSAQALNPNAKPFTFPGASAPHAASSASCSVLSPPDEEREMQPANHYNTSPFSRLNVNAQSFKMDSSTSMLTSIPSTTTIDEINPQTTQPTSTSNAATPSVSPSNGSTPLDDDTVLAMHGFRKLGKMKDSLQGAVYFGETIRGHEICGKLNIPANKKRRVVIKKTLKSLHRKRISAEHADGLNIVVDENVVKEAIILHHLTVKNNPAGSAICKLLSFFESSRAYYIVLEYCGKLTLKDFVEKAHAYIKQGKLAVSHWKKICKYVAWQISATLYWMHSDMQCAHLDLTLDNIIVSNGSFIVDESTGKVSIDRNLSCKIIDFGLSEVFQASSGKSKSYFPYDPDTAQLGLFHINNKYSIASNHQSPQIFDEQVYDARKADMWSLGVVMFFMSFGRYPYHKQLETEPGFWAIKHGKLNEYIQLEALQHLAGNKLISLISSCLCTDESERCLVDKVITNVWFKQYFKRYADKMQEQSAAQLEKNNGNAAKLEKSVPFYAATENSPW